MEKNNCNCFSHPSMCNKVTLPNGFKTDTWSKDYMLFCEAKTLARWKLKKRQDFINGCFFGSVENEKIYT
jgi:hypothetical protein